MRSPLPSSPLPRYINGRSIMAWRRWAQLDDVHDVIVPIVQLGTGRAVQFAADLQSAIKVQRVAPVPTASATRSRADGISKVLGVIGIAVVGGLAIHRAWKRAERSANAINGYASEDVIADRLEDVWGGVVDVSPGSRGAADLDARLTIGRFAVQVKSSRRGEARWPRPDEIERLKLLATRRRARAVVALRSGTRTTFHHARTREPIDL